MNTVPLLCRYAAGDGARCSPSTAQQPRPAAGSCSESSSSPAATEPNSLHLNTRAAFETHTKTFIMII